MPGVQNPHCEAPWRRKHSCSGCMASPGPMSPRSVVSRRPAACTARIRQPFTGSSSSSTVQVPQTPSPHP